MELREEFKELKERMEEFENKIEGQKHELTPELKNVITNVIRELSKGILRGTMNIERVHQDVLFSYSRVLKLASVLNIKDVDQPNPNLKPRNFKRVTKRKKRQ